MSAELLERLGKPADVLIHLDFETFYDSDYTLRKLTTEAYVRDPRFEVLGVGVRVGKGPTVWLEEWEFSEWSKRVNWARCAVNAHHAQFDGLILAERYGFRPGFWCCTMSMGRALTGKGSLEDLGQHFGLGGKVEGALAATKGKHRRDLTQREWLAFGDYCKRDVALGADLLRLMRQGFPRLELWLIDTTIRMFTEASFVGNVDVLTTARDAERKKKRAFLQRLAGGEGADPIEAARATLSSSDKFAELLRSMGIDPPTKPNPKGETIFAFAKSDPGMAALLEHPRDEVRFLAEARLAVKSTIVETRTERMIGISQRGRVPIYLKFCGAHTHRWSGGDKMNPQNFNRGGDLRDALEVDEESAIVVADSGQIEARVLPWFARELKLLETFRRNDAKTRAYDAELARLVAAGVPKKDAERQAGEPGDFYSDEGSSYFGKRLSKRETPAERQISKAMILGLGFGMGWEKFGAQLLVGMLGTPPVQFRREDADRFGADVAAFIARPFGNEGTTCGQRVAASGVRLSPAEAVIHFAVADHLVRRYRDANRRIVATWRTLENALRIMEAPGGDPNEVRLTLGPLKVIRHGLVKPSGLVLRYPGLRRGPEGFSYMGGKSGRERVKVYGGLLTENVVQSLARDIVAAQALEVRAAGYRIATTTHDEIVSVVPRAEGPRALGVMLAAMRRAPAWCADLPLNAEGGHGTSYGACK